MKVRKRRRPDRPLNYLIDRKPVPPLVGSTCGNAFAVKSGRNAIIGHASGSKLFHPVNGGLFAFRRTISRKISDAKIQYRTSVCLRNRAKSDYAARASRRSFEGFRPGTVSYRQYDTISPPAIHHARMLEQAKPAAMIIEFGGMRYAGVDPSLVFTGATPPRDGLAPAPRGRWFCSRNIR